MNEEDWHVLKVNVGYKGRNEQTGLTTKNPNLQQVLQSTKTFLNTCDSGVSITSKMAIIKVFNIE